ncbi:hypothetical protein CO666_19680 [Rhizobium chutanense]|uniref:Uncharacterized protein n=1 Tax=Rhizobium chutanense TaxID=2035448 RepID=A0A2A6J8R1_9HYPH|nr:hypothetical protein CO666_19680 [Rhizobium chutanense]
MAEARRRIGRLLGLKRVAIFQIRSSRFRSLFSHIVAAKPLHTFARHALECRSRSSDQPAPVSPLSFMLQKSISCCELIGRARA